MISDLPLVWKADIQGYPTGILSYMEYSFLWLTRLSALSDSETI